MQAPAPGAEGRLAITDSMRQRALSRIIDAMSKFAQVTEVKDPKAWAQMHERMIFGKVGGYADKYEQMMLSFLRQISEKYRSAMAHRIQEKNNAVTEFVNANGSQFATVADVAEGIDDRGRLRHWLFSQMYNERIRSLKLFIPMSKSDAKEAKLIHDACDELANFMKRGPGESSMTIQAIKTRAQAVDRFEDDLVRYFGFSSRTELNIHYGPPLAVLESIIARNNKELLERVSKRAKVVTSDAELACLFRA